jgi:tetratricopeptide (TPR) repeat protein
MAIDKNKAIANAQRFTQKGQLDRALKEYQAIVAEDPDDVRIWLKIGDLFTKKQAVSQAVSTYDRVAVYYSERGFFLKAVAVWKQILNIDPSYTEAHLKLAELYVQLGLAPDAIGQYQLVVGAYEREGRHRDSVLLLRKIVELAPDDIPSRIRLAEAFARQNENPKAVEEFKVVLEQLHQRERWDEAIQVGERVAYLAPEDTENLRLVSEVYLRRGDARRALARLQTCFKASPTDIPTLELLARAFAELGQVPKAVSVYRELARLHEEDDNSAGRLEAFRRILVLDPTDVEAISATGGGGRGRVQPQPLPSQVLFTQGITSTQGMQRLGAIAQPLEVLSPDEQIRRHLSDVDLLLKYGLGDHALQTTDKVLALDPEHEATLVKRKDIAIAINRRDEAIASILRLAALAEKRNPEQAMTWLGEALQISPHHTEANQRMQRLSSGMAAGLRRQAATGPQAAIIEMAPPDDYPDLDLGALDFGDDGPIEPVNTPDPEADLAALDLDFEDDAPPPPARSVPAASIELPPVQDAGEDDFGGLLDAGDDDFQDLLGGDEPDVAPVVRAAGPPAPDELATPRPGDLVAEDETDFGGLLVGPRLSNPTAPTPIVGLVGNAAPTPSAVETPVRGISLVPGITGAPTPQPLADDFGDLGPMDLPDDDFSDLLSDEAVPDARPGQAVITGADDFDFGDLALGDDASVHDALPAAGVTGRFETPAPSEPPTPAPSAPLRAEDAPTPQPEALPPIAAGFDDATAFNFGDLLPDDLQGALDAAESAAAEASAQSEEASLVDLSPPGDSQEAGASADASVEADFDFDLGPEALPEPPAPTPETPADAEPVLAEPAPEDAVEAPAAASFGNEISVELDAPESEPDAPEPELDVEFAGFEPETPAPDEGAAAPADAPDGGSDAPASGNPAGAADDDAFFAQFGDLGDEPVGTPEPAAEASGVEPTGVPVPEDAGFEADALTEARAYGEVPASPETPAVAADDPFAGLLDLDDSAGASNDAEPEIEEPAPDFAPETPAVHEALQGLHIDEPEPGPPAATSDVAAALSDLLGPSVVQRAPATAAVADAFAELADDGEDEDADRTVFAQPDAFNGSATASVNPRISDAPVAPRPVSVAPVSLGADDDGRGVDVEMEVASLPGVDMGLDAPEDLEPIEEIDDIELLDEDLDVLDEGDGEDEEPSGVDAEAPARRPMVDARTVMAAVSVADIEDEMAEVDFLIESGLAADAREAVEDLAATHGIGHPAIQRRINRILELENDAREAENAVALMAATEPTPVGPLTGATPDDLSDADVAAHFDLGVAYMEMGQYKKAIAQLQKVAAHRERRAEALRVIGLCELQQGNAQAAVKHLEDALAVPGLTRDGRVGLLYDLATAYETMGNRIAARTQLKGIVDLGAGEFLDVRDRLTRLA